MECKTINHVNKGGKAILRNKKKYNNFSDAQKDADRINEQECAYSRRVVYKCTQCNFYHVGTSEASLNKPVPKKIGVINTSRAPKVVGFMNLKDLEIRTDRELDLLHFQFLLKYGLV